MKVNSIPDMGAFRQRKAGDRASDILAQPLEERVPHLSFRGLRAVLDLGKQFRLDPDSPVRDPLGEGLRLPDERLQPLAQVGS